MQESPPIADEQDLLLLIRRSLRHRRVLCELVLATYRVELTSILHRMAGDGVADGDVDVIEQLAQRVTVAAGVASLGSVRADAMRLRERAAAAHCGDDRAEGAMLMAGLKLIDRILDSARSGSSVVPEANALN